MRGGGAIRVLLTRTGALIGTLLIASVVIYGSLYLAPGSPLGFIIGGHPVSAKEIAAIKAEYHLGESFPLAYWHWLIAILHGNFGQSIVTRESVVSSLSPRIGATLLLVAYAGLLVVVIGVGSGTLAALRPRGIGPVVTISTTVGMAVPSFVVAVFLITVFSLELGWFPALGAGSGLGDMLYHLTLPAVALALYLTAYVSRITRLAVADELGREHVETARVRGLPESAVIRRHVLRNAWIPITTVAGVSVAALVAGDAVVEQAFGLNGIGAYLVQAVQTKDYPVVQAIVLMMVAVFVVISTLVDIGYALADPRVGSKKART